MPQSAILDGAHAKNLGPYLKKARLDRQMTLRDVEDATGKEVSNAYLSQLESGRITKPSPHVLHALSGALQVPYENLMQRAGYIIPAAMRPASKRKAAVASFSVDNLSAEEETALLDYLSFIRSKKK